MKLTKQETHNNILYVPATFQKTGSGKYCYSDRFSRKVSHAFGQANDNAAYGLFRPPADGAVVGQPWYFFVPAETEQDIASYPQEAVICIPNDVSAPAYLLTHEQARQDISAPATQPQASEQLPA